MKAPEDLRRRLLDASLDLIATEGLEAFSMREVARRAGVSHQAPYHHFADREAIIAAIVAEGFAQLRDDMAAAQARAKADAPARLKALGMAYVAFAIRQPAHFKLMFRSEWVRAEEHAAAKSCAQEAFGVLTATVEEVSRAQGRPPGDMSPVLIAWSLAHGFSTLMLEGKLEHVLGVSPDRYLDAADALLDTFSAMNRVR